MSLMWYGIFKKWWPPIPNSVLQSQGEVETSDVERDDISPESLPLGVPRGGKRAIVLPRLGLLAPQRGQSCLRSRGGAGRRRVASGRVGWQLAQQSPSSRWAQRAVVELTARGIPAERVSSARCRVS
jgi:hypothetical protein